MRSLMVGSGGQRVLSGDTPLLNGPGFESYDIVTVVALHGDTTPAVIVVHLRYILNALQTSGGFGDEEMSRVLGRIR